jgi:hypothetical protein
VVFGNASDGPGAILVKVYGRPSADSYKVPARFELPDNVPDSPGVFEQFMRLYHRLAEPPPVELKTTLAKNLQNPFAEDVLVSLDPKTGAGSGDIYVLKKYEPFSEALLRYDKAPSLPNAASGKILWSYKNRLKLLSETVPAGDSAAFSKTWQQGIDGLTAFLRDLALMQDVVLTSEDGQVDFGPAFRGGHPAGPVSIRTYPSEGKGGDFSNLDIILSWTSAAGTAKPRFAAPLSTGLYALSYFDVSLQRNIGGDARILVVSLSARSNVNMLLNDFNQHISSWGDVVDDQTKRQLTRGFLRFLAESARN